MYAWCVNYFEVKWWGICLPNQSIRATKGYETLCEFDPKYNSFIDAVKVIFNML
jgi:glutamine cyclotransferase